MGTAPIGRMNDWHWTDGKKANTVSWISSSCLKCNRLISIAKRDLRPRYDCDMDECPAEHLSKQAQQWININIKRFDKLGNYR